VQSSNTSAATRGAADQFCADDSSTLPVLASARGAGEFGGFHAGVAGHVGGGGALDAAVRIHLPVRHRRVAAAAGQQRR
jgi:hypothetical protein